MSWDQFRLGSLGDTRYFVLVFCVIHRRLLKVDGCLSYGPKFKGDRSYSKTAMLLQKKNQSVSEMSPIIWVSWQENSVVWDQILIKSLGSDNGGEYLSTDIKNFLREKGIQNQLTVAHTPSETGMQNGWNEPLSIWSVRCYTTRVLPSISKPRRFPGLAMFWIALFQVIFQRKTLFTIAGIVITTGISHMRVFSAQFWYVMPKTKLKKMYPRSREALMMRYSSRGRDISCWTMAQKK